LYFCCLITNADSKQDIPDEVGFLGFVYINSESIKHKIEQNV